MNEKINACLTKEQQLEVEKWYNYVISITSSWAARNNMFWCIDELLSMASITLIRCVIRYQPDLESNSSFKTYLYSGLIRCYKRVSMNEMGLKRFSEDNYEWKNIFIDTEFFEPYKEDPRFDYFEFDDILNKSKLLKESDKQILRSFFIEDKSLTDIGKEFGLSRERIRQKKVKALNNIRKVIEW